MNKKNVKISQTLMTSSSQDQMTLKKNPEKTAKHHVNEGSAPGTESKCGILGAATLHKDQL